MPSLIPGYNYDIFISYRQKDNKHDGWVTKFVENLKGEVEATFKEDVSVYFDENPHDRLQETHNVDKSLEGKLKCLIFIPILSQTYCDPNSYAWQYEFLAFIKLAAEDCFGREIRLKSGNYTSRILPIRIHDLEPEDAKLFEKETGSVLRAMDFVFRTASGVNRPLKTDEDHPHDNLNNTFYSDQINKVGHAIKEIIIGMKTGSTEYAPEQKVLSTKDVSTIREKSIAVMPFVDMSPDRDQDYFCEGMAEEIINTLSHNESLKVIARTSAFAFKDKNEDIREIGRKLGVETLLEGSVRKIGNRLRITAQLIKVDDSSHLWSDRYDREMKDVFAIQDEISQAILDNLRIKLLGEKRPVIAKLHSENLEAYNLYLKGMYCYQMMTVEGFKKAVEYFEEALQKDQDYALVYAGLIGVIINSTAYGNVPPNKAYPKAIDYVNKALKIDNTNPGAYNALGVINTFYNWNWKEAERNFKYTLQIDPNRPFSHLYYSFLLTCTGRNEEAISEAKRAQELDPLSVYIYTYTGRTFEYAGLNERAIEEHRMALTLNPNYYLAHLFLGMVYIRESMFKEAVAECKKAVDLSNGNPYTISWLIYGYCQIGKIDQAEKLFDSLKNRSKTEYVPATTFYLIHRARGEENLALEWLKRACDNREIFIPWFRFHPVLIPEGSRYMALLKEAGMD